MCSHVKLCELGKESKLNMDSCEKNIFKDLKIWCENITLKLHEKITTVKILCENSFIMKKITCEHNLIVKSHMRKYFNYEKSRENNLIVKNRKKQYFKS